VTCSNCGTDNREGRKFCSACGNSLAVVCGVCGAANEPQDRFCGECGSALDIATVGAPTAAGNGGSVAERRLVSVLFADLVGFTTLSESRDPEEVRELLSRYFETARTVIDRYGGVVEKFIGDAVMAVWGAPVANEDDAERAVRAALDLVAAVSAMGEDVHAPELAARAGVATGDAAVTLGDRG
jgi:class 3 adenylate cyclase